MCGPDGMPKKTLDRPAPQPGAGHGVARRSRCDGGTRRAVATAARDGAAGWAGGTDAVGMSGGVGTLGAGLAAALARRCAPFARRSSWVTFLKHARWKMVRCDPTWTWTTGL